MHKGIEEISKVVVPLIGALGLVAAGTGVAYYFYKQDISYNEKYKQAKLRDLDTILTKENNKADYPSRFIESKLSDVTTLLQKEGITDTAAQMIFDILYHRIKEEFSGLSVMYKRQRRQAFNTDNDRKYISIINQQKTSYFLLFTRELKEIVNDIDCSKKLLTELLAYLDLKEFQSELFRRLALYIPNSAHFQAWVLSTRGESEPPELDPETILKIYNFKEKEHKNFSKFASADPTLRKYAQLNYISDLVHSRFGVEEEEIFEGISNNLLKLI